uniref:Uncharacterized protein n=1 Tax=Parascaris equorum TaxID=6256 RepID=A0A914R983_PAREQ
MNANSLDVAENYLHGAVNRDEKSFVLSVTVPLGTALSVSFQFVVFVYRHTFLITNGLGQGSREEVYCAEEREVERLTYRPASFSSSTNPRESENPSRYPIVELSVPKPSTHRSSSLDIRSNEIPVTEYDSNFSSSWSRLGTHSTNQRDYSRLYRSPRSEHFSPTPQETIKTSSQRLQSSNIRSNFDKLSSALNRSFYEQADSLINTTSGNTSSGHKLLDISSLDALLESAFDGDDEDMSKSTKEWRSSFSSMRDRFGSRELSDELTANFVDFTTNGSLTLPRRGLSKSASQGSMILGRRSESTLLGRFGVLVLFVESSQKGK